jgi:predicted Rossmann fold flavoprotein
MADYGEIEMKGFFDGASVIVIGGGAAGMMAAVSAARNGADVLLFEKNDRLGKKLRITGKGRCNVTNDCDKNEFLSNVASNSKFLFAALSRFSTADTKDFFEECGVPLKTERGKRVFPVSDKAQDIVSALENACVEAGVRILNKRVDSLIIDEGAACGVVADGESYSAKSVIVCTGGASYPRTGSTGDGYRFAKKAGHKIVDIKPSLVPLVAEGKLCAHLQGVSLKNIGFKIRDNSSGKIVYDDFGEMMFTHFGITGPVVLSASAHLSDIERGKYTAIIDMKPALDHKTLDSRILSDFSECINKDFINSLDALLPQKMIPIMVGLSGIDARKKVNSITKEEREKLVSLIKGIEIPIEGFRPINEAIITKGGVAVSEVSPKTMESKITRGLYFAGEVLDLDAYTGGFNLQIAFSTATLAGENAAWSSFE